MTFIAIDTDLEEDPKLHALILARGWKIERGLIFMFRFWKAVRRHAASGDVTEWTDSYVAAQTGKGKLSGLIDDLIAVGLLLRQGDRLIVDRWDEMNGRWIRSNLSKEQRSAGGRARATTASRNEFGRYVRQSDPGVPRGLPGPPHPGEPEPEPEPEPKEDGAEPSASAPCGAAKDPGMDEGPEAIRFPALRREVYVVTVHQVARWSELYPAVDVMAVLRKALGWIEANPTHRKTAKRMPRWIVNTWLSRDQDRARVPVPVSASEVFPPEERRRRERERAERSARDLEESRKADRIDADPATAEKFDKALKLHRGEIAEEAEEGIRHA